MDELTNPYRPGAGTSPPALVGRDELIDHFGTTVRRAVAGRPGKSLMPIGLRGVGKTVLLNRFAEIADQEGLAVGFIEAPETGEFASLLVGRLRKVLLGFDGRRKTAKVLKALRILKTFALQLPDGSTVSLDVDALVGAADSGNLTDDVTDLLVAAGEAAAERDSGILLAIDEVQYLAAVELAALITAVHRTTQLDLPIVVVGAGLPQLPGLVGDAKSYAERLFEFPAVGPLDPDDARAAIRLPAAEQGVELTDGALDAIVELARGLPLLPAGVGLPRLERGRAQPPRSGPRRAADPGGDPAPRRQLLPRPLRSPHPRRASLPAGDGRARAGPAPLRQHRPTARGQGGDGGAAPRRAHRQGDAVQPGARRHRVHRPAVRRVPPPGDARRVRRRSGDSADRN